MSDELDGLIEKMARAIDPNAWMAMGSKILAYDRGQSIRQATAALETLSPTTLAALPGLEAGTARLVPVEPTEEMMAEGWGEVNQALCESGKRTALVALYKAMLSAAPSIPSPPVAGTGGWLPIASAPKDGTHFLAYEPDGSMYRAAFHSEGYIQSFCGQYVTTPPEPTHWRPVLPSPPVAAAKEVEA